MENVFVTVGTTEFESLIQIVGSKDFHQILKKLGCNKLNVQFGRGKDPAFDADFQDIEVDTFDLKATISEDIAEADLVISHAGAGSCIDVLSAGKCLVVVVNEELMHNHQTELAEQLHKDGYLYYCTPASLGKTLLESDFSKLKAYEKGKAENFVKFLDNFMGF